MSARPNSTAMSSDHTPPIGEGRRTPRRHHATSRRARIVWREEPSRYGRAQACLIDIGEEGARILTTGGHPTRGVVWVGLSSLPWEWVKATIQTVGSYESTWIFSLRFSEPCPPGLLDHATQSRRSRGRAHKADRGAARGEP